MDDNILTVLEKYPFMSYGSQQDMQYLGIIQNADSSLVSMYDFASIPTSEMRMEFLRLGEQWWWESNRQIPIHIFFKDRFRVFRPYLKHFAKDFELLAGPSVSLQETIAKRVRRRHTLLVKKID